MASTPKSGDRRAGTSMKAVVEAAVTEGKKPPDQQRRKKREKNEDRRPPGSGLDDGTAAKKLLMGYVDQVLEQVQSPDAREMPDHIKANKTWKESSFLERLQHKDLVDVPLHSQLTRQKAMVPNHETAKMNLFIGVCESLKRNDGGMVRARLSGEMIDDKVVKMIALALPNNVYLQHLMLHDNVVTDLGVEALCHSLRWHPMIQTIWLGGNLISDRGAQALAKLVGMNHNVIDINLSNKRPRKSWGDSNDVVHPEISYLGAEAFAKQLYRSAGLTSLSLAEHKIRDIGARMLFKALPNSKLRTLNLKACGLTHNCCAALQTALRDQPVLEKLVLSKNDIGDDGTVELCQGLAHNSVLQALDLSYNGIRDLGMNAILLCLERNHTLSALSTMYNDSTDDRADRIVEMRAGAVRALDKHLDRIGESVGGGVDAGGAPLSANTMATLRRIAEESFKLDYKNSEPGRGKGVDLAAIAMPKRAREILSRAGSAAGGSRGGGSRGSPRDAGRGASRGTSRSASRSPSRGASRTREVYNSPLSTPGGEERRRKEEGSGLDLTTGWRESEARKTPSVPSVSVGGMRPRSRPLRSELEGEERDATGIRLLNSRSRSSRGGSRSPSQRGENRAESANNMEGFLEMFESESDDLQRAGSSKSSRNFVVTERMRLGHQLPHSPYRRYFDDSDRPKLSRELGMTRGVPNVGNVGVMPVRNTVSRFKDSAQHLTYLRVATPDDPPEARPVSLIQIALDQKAFADKVRAERQTPLYKELKRDAMDFVPRGKQRAAAKQIPPEFWDKWKRRMRTRYPRGIDRATKVTSTDLNEFKRPVIIRDGKAVLDKAKAAVKTPGQALVWRREQRAAELAKEKALYTGEVSIDPGASTTIGQAKKLAHDILGLRPDQTLSDIYTNRQDGKYRKGLTTRIGWQEQPESFISKEFKAY